MVNFINLFFNHDITQVFQSQLRDIVDVRAVHDFDSFLSSYRPKSDDRNIRKQFAFTFEVRENDKIFVRSKSRCAATTPWGPWFQMVPHPDSRDGVVHSPDTCPAMAAPKPWPKFRDELVPGLIRFYEREFVHPVHIPDRDLEDMRRLLRDGPPPPVAPEWIHWGVNPRISAGAVSDEPEVGMEPESDDEHWVPFLQPRRKRARVDDDTTVSKGDSDSDGSDGSDDSDSQEDSPVFPYPVGTKVARDFGEDGIFWGTIVNHYGDDNSLCVVRYTDGDQEDMDKDEVSYAVDLYQQEFGAEEAK